MKLMTAPKFSKCPGCGVEPQPARDSRDSLGLWCEKCGFNSSLADEMHADYLVQFYPKLNIRTVADRIKNRQPLMHSRAKIA
jgi:hypothetical protein